MAQNKGDWQPPATIDDIYKATQGNKFDGINRPTAGARTDDEVRFGGTCVCVRAYVPVTTVVHTFLHIPMNAMYVHSFTSECISVW